MAAISEIFLYLQLQPVLICRDERITLKFNTSTLLFPFQDPLKQLKDLTQLRKQLEEIQRRVENEISVGIPQVCCCNTSISNFARAQYTVRILTVIANSSVGYIPVLN